jgi:hypothetical protein
MSKGGVLTLHNDDEDSDSEQKRRSAQASKPTALGPDAFNPRRRPYYSKLHDP